MGSEMCIRDSRKTRQRARTAAPDLTRFSQGEKFDEATDFYAWKGYNFDILNELSDADYIRQGSHPSRSKSVYITESGMEQAQKLLARYGIDDWKRS